MKNSLLGFSFAVLFFFVLLVFSPRAFAQWIVPPIGSCTTGTRDANGYCITAGAPSNPFCYSNPCNMYFFDQACNFNGQAVCAVQQPNPPMGCEKTGNDCAIVKFGPGTQCKNDNISHYTNGATYANYGQPGGIPPGNWVGCSSSDPNAPNYSGKFYGFQFYIPTPTPTPTPTPS